MKTTKYNIRKLLAAAREGPLAVAALRWGNSGRPRKTNLPEPTARQIKIGTNRATMSRLSGLPMEARAQDFEERYGARMPVHAYRKMYRLRKKKPLVMRPPLGAGTNLTAEEQRPLITALQDAIEQAQTEGAEIIQVDESLFVGQRETEKEWASKGQPFTKPSRRCKEKPETVIGAISDLRGFIGAYSQPKAFKAPEVLEFLKELKETTDRPFVVLLDNATVHTAKKNVEYCEANGIKLIRNVAYRPDFNGIEQFWKLLKAKYRPVVRSHLVRNERWNQAKLLEKLMLEVDDEKVKDCARFGLRQIKKGKAVEPICGLDRQIKEAPEPICMAF